MPSMLTRRRHRFDALFAVLTGRGTPLVPQDPRLRRDIGLSEPFAPVEPSHFTLAALAHHARCIERSLP